MRLLSVCRLGMIVFVAALLGGQPPATVSASSTPAPAADTTVTPMVDAGATHTCGLKPDGSVACWGDNAYGESNPPFLNSGFTQVDAGSSHTCGLKSDSSAVCWGFNNFGQNDVPSPNSDFIQISAGNLYTCGLKSDGSVTCWGYDYFGQLDLPSPNSGFTQISTSTSHVCGLKSDGSITCWGDNTYGELNAPSPNSGFTQVSAGYFYTCGLRSEGSVACWGDNKNGELTIPSPNSDFTQVSAGYYHACGLKRDGSAACWGHNTYGESNVPSPNSGFAQISAGGYQTCAMKADGAYFCWGYNNHGQAPAVSVSPLALPAGQYGTAYSQALSASGATIDPPYYTYDTPFDAPPAGLSLSPDGVLSGTPAQSGAFTFWVRARDANNYMGASQVTLTVDKAPLAIVADSVHSTYGSTPTLTYTAYGFFNSDTTAALSGAPSITTPAGPTSPVGSYPISITQGTLAAANYNFVLFTSGGHMVTVDPALLTVRAVDKSKRYGANTPLPELEYTITGFANGELKENVVSGEPVLSTSATAASPIGEYVITVAQNSDDARKLSAANYTFAFASGKLTVTGFRGYAPLVHR